ncbi:Branched-chain amino acid transport protein [Mameliella alba]|jgi:branched-subunit amino acid transport protein|uniref:AzlD domain-containing protein n=1 Tax=Mameliella alba TaxID=561184 RepID=UPI00089114E0|nr:AzlD domain-containing protein [Mameliella alba]OWV46742.1 AzlD domain-containing protein [Mameliella alba]PTR37655.1 branched-subunit amino acid transport protein [Mameliella alba]GGF49919.1 membrane protein [Mameliella alba]SDD65069.1 Branched-chain amino acid transport protein [Mameliella alba]
MKDLWIVIIGMGLGSFALRFVFLGLVGDRAMPDWLLRHLRYTAVAVMPALVAPLVIWPSATGGETDPLRLAAAAAALIVGYVTKSLYGAVGAGAAVMIAGAWLPF